MTSAASSSNRAADREEAARRRAETLAQKVPKPPERLAVKGPAYPLRPDMGPSYRRWVDDVKAIADSASSAVAAAQCTREQAQASRKSNMTQVVASAHETEGEARRRVEKMSQEVRAVRQTYDSVNAELVAMLRSRNSAREKLAAVEKPLRDLFRRIEYRQKEMPAAETTCDSVTRDLVKGAQCLSDAVSELQATQERAERAAAQLDDISRALRRDLEHREKLLNEDAVFVDSAASALDGTPRGRGSSHLSSPRLPPVSMVPPASISPRSVHGQVSAAREQSERRGAVEPTTTRSAAGSGRSHPYLVTSPKRVAELATQAIADSGSIRALLKKTSRAVDEAVTKNTRLVEESAQRTIDDTTALLKILNDRVRLVDSELAEVAAQRDAAIAELRTLVGPLEDAAAKLQHRKAAKQKSKTIPEAGLKKDTLTEASARETGRLQAAISALRAQLHALDAQHTRLAHTRRELETAIASKQRLLAVDQRVLTIGNTPRPNSLMSNASSKRMSPRGGRTTVHD